MKFERGLNPKNAMNIGDIELRKKEEQEEAARRMIEAHMAEAAIYDALHYLEENLGKVHKVTIDFRKNMTKKYNESTRKAADEFEKCGGLEACMQRIEEREKTQSDNIISNIPLLKWRMKYEE